MTRASDTLRVPFGRDARGTAVPPVEAQPDRDYFCPECGWQLVLRRGDTRVRHFAHRKNAPACALAGDGWLHTTAEHIVVASVERWLSGRTSAPVVEYACRVRHGRWVPACEKTVSASLESLRVARAVREHTLKSRQLRVDVLLMDADGRPVLGVEVRDTHAVDSAKRDRLAPLPFIEVDALGILSNWLLWRAEYEQGLERFGVCPHHPRRAPARERSARRRTMQEGIPSGRALPVFAVFNERAAPRAYHLSVPACPDRRLSMDGVPCFGCAHHGGYRSTPGNWPLAGEAWGLVTCRHGSLAPE